MNKLLKFSTSDAEEFFIEINDSANEVTMRHNSGNADDRNLIQNTHVTFEKALKPLKEISNTIISSVKEVINSPNEIEVELNLKFTARAGIILASVDSEAHLKITLKWENATAGTLKNNKP